MFKQFSFEFYLWRLSFELKVSYLQTCDFWDMKTLPRAQLPSFLTFFN